METANDSSTRRSAIAAALSAEIERQANTGASRIDVDALADAVTQAIDPPASPAAEGKRPYELNSTNDD